LRLLGARGLTRVLCEGGPDLAQSLARLGLIDELTLVSAPTGGGEGDVLAVRPGLADAISSLRAVGVEDVGVDRFSYFERS
jgi:diaminohydroxyphosphoribosylaminopyrimidine deaminase / 5-amino-6-(5-phosphoribosylamino)uracil reductase